MTTPVYGVRIVDRKISGDLFPVFVSIWFSERGAGEYSTAELSETDEKIEKDDSRFVASLPIDHPAGVVITKDNWGGFFYHRLFSKDRMKMDFATKFISKKRGCKSVESYPSFGYYFFKVETNHGETIGILVDRPEGTYRTSRRFPGATLIGVDNDHDHVQYNDEHLIVQSSINVVAGDRGNHYSIDFRKNLSPEQVMKIYVEGTSTVSFTADMFQEPILQEPTEREISRYGVAHDDRYKMRAKSVWGLEYIESVDGKVLIFLQRYPGREILIAYRNMIIEKEAKGCNPLSLDILRATYQELLSHYALSNVPAEEVKIFLQKCLGLLTDQV